MSNVFTTLWAQSCNCNINLGSDVNLENWSTSGEYSTGTLVNKHYCVYGNLNIDITQKFLLCYFDMSPGSTITVINGATFNSKGSHFNKCGSGNMWQGIIVENGIIDFMTNTIRDAIIGIKNTSGNQFKNFTYNIFDRCSIGVHLVNYTSTRPFIGNNFVCNGTLSPPFLGTKTWAGMELSNVMITEQKGRYDNLFIGVRINDATPTTSYTSENGTFTNIQNSCIAGITTKNITANNNTFRNCFSGIGVTNLVNGLGAIINAEENYFHNVFTGISIYFGKEHTINIKNNYMDSIIGTGIKLYESYPFTDFNIKSNKFYFKNETTYLDAGIDVSNIPGSIFPNEILIQDNHVFQEENNCPLLYGYELIGLDNLKFDVNSASYSAYSLSSKYGLELKSTTNANITNNTFTGGGLANTPVSHGIYQSKSSNVNYCCNVVDNIGTGIELFDANNNSKLRGFTYKGNLHNYSMLFNTTMTGVSQEFPGNNWNGSAPVDAAFINGDPQEAKDNPFNSNVGLPFYPDDPINGPTGWFKTEQANEYLCENDGNCNGVQGNGCTDYPNDELLLVTGYSGLYGVELTWQARLNVLRQLYNDPNYGCNTTLINTFKSNNQNTALGKLATLSINVSSLFVPSSIQNAQLSQLQSTIENELTQISNIDTYFDIDGEDYDYWENERTIHVNILNTALNNYSTIVNTIKNTALGLIPGLIADLSSISSTNTMESNQKYVFDYYLNNLLNPAPLNSSTYQALSNIADQCPITGGEAVYFARVILKSMDPNYINNGVNCSGIVGQRSKSFQGNPVDVFDIIPNPSSGNMVINSETNQVIHDIQISDLHGKILYKMKNPISKEISIDLPNGLYLIQISLADSKVITKKLVIEK